MIAKIQDDKLIVLEEAHFDGDILYGLTHVEFTVTEKEIGKVLSALSFLKKNDWDEVRTSDSVEWISNDEDEEVYVSRREDDVFIDEVIMGDQRSVSSQGSGCISGYEKYSGTEAFSNSFSWWPLIAHFVDWPTVVKGNIVIDVPFSDTLISAKANVLTGEVSAVESLDCYNVDDVIFSCKIGSDNKELDVGIEKHDSGWRLLKSSLALVQLRFGQKMRKEFIY